MSLDEMFKLFLNNRAEMYSFNLRDTRAISGIPRAGRGTFRAAGEDFPITVLDPHTGDEWSFNASEVVSAPHIGTFTPTE